MYLKIKRLVDIILTFIGLIFLFPLFLLLIIAIKLDSKGPILFKQKTVGIHKVYYKLLRFYSILQINLLKEIKIYSSEFIDAWITEITQFLQKFFPNNLFGSINIPIWDIITIYHKSILWNNFYLRNE